MDHTFKMGTSNEWMWAMHIMQSSEVFKKGIEIIRSIYGTLINNKQKEENDVKLI